MNTDYRRMNTEHGYALKKIIMLIEEQLSYKVRGCIYSVATKYGRGLKEKIYQKALAEEFEKEKLIFEQQKRIDVFSFETGKKLGTYIPDFVVEDKIIVEIKASGFINKQDVEQHRSYLRISIYEISFLVNFNSDKLDIRRAIFTNDRKPFIARIRAP